MIIGRGGESENIAALQLLEHAILRQRAGESDERTQPQLIDVLLQVFPQRAVADDLAPELDAALAQLLARFDQVFEPLERDQPADAQDLHRPGV